MPRQSKSYKDNLNNVFLMVKYAFITAPLETTGLYVFNIVVGLTPIAAGYLLKFLIDRLTDQPTTLELVFLPFVLYVMFKGIARVMEILKFSLIDNLFVWKIQDKVVVDFNNKLFDVDISAFEDSETYDTMLKAKDTMKWRSFELIQDSSRFIASVFGLLASVIVFIKFDPIIPFVLILLSLPGLIIGMKFGKASWSIYDAGAGFYKQVDYLSGLIMNAHYMPELRVFQAKNKIVDTISDLQREFFLKNKKIAIKYGFINSLAYLVSIAGVGIILVNQLQKTVNGQISIGTFSFLLITVYVLLDAIDQALTNATGVYNRSRQVGYFFDILALKRKVLLPENPIIPKLEKTAPEIEFRNVSFRYKDGQPNILNNLSFKIEAGKNIALVGENGAGKSTIIKLLVRFYDANEGEILINGINIKEIDLDWWYKNVGTLFQQFINYNFTVKESISLESDNIDLDRVKRAAELSGADEFIESFPNKYDQMLGVNYEEGKELSGGQWQKIALARAFYKMPSLLILDEPTSAIDAQAEYEIFKNINEIYADGKSLLIVSHRFSTVRNAEKILVLEKGHLVEEGTHDQLMAKNGLYSRMFNVQAEGYK